MFICLKPPGYSPSSKEFKAETQTETEAMEKYHLAHSVSFSPGFIIQHRPTYLMKMLPTMG